MEGYVSDDVSIHRCPVVIMLGNLAMMSFVTIRHSSLSNNIDGSQLAGLADMPCPIASWLMQKKSNEGNGMG